MPIKSGKRKGQVLIVALGIALVLLIIVPALVLMVTKESRLTVKEKKSSTAYYLAEGGIERGYWVMQSNPNYFALLASATVAGYNFDVAYSDVQGLGDYTIRLSSTSLFGTALTSNQRTITAAGRDKDKKEIRTIELVIQIPGQVNGAIQANGVQMGGGGTVHWGPMYSLGGMSFSGASAVRFPRKFMKLGLSRTAFSDTSPAQFNYDTDAPNPHTEFWTYNEPPGVPDAPNVDTGFYKNLAQFSTAAVAEGYPGGGHYYPDTGTTILSGDTCDSQDSVYYSAGSLKFTGCVGTRGVIAAVGSVTFVGGPCGKNKCPVGRYPQTVNIPSSAYMEYQKLQNVAPVAFPGDLRTAAGQPITQLSVSPTYTFGTALNSATATESDKNTTISHFGFIFCGGGAPSWNAGGGTIVVGAILAPNDDGSGSGGSTLYYQDNLVIHMSTTGNFSRYAWHQEKPYWPPLVP